MSQKVSIFRTPESEAEYRQAYAAALTLWPVPYEEIFVPTRFGETHVVVSGQPGAPAMVLFHGTGGGATIWYRNVEAFSRYFRVYAIDTIAEANESRPARAVNGRREFVEWIEALFDGLGIESACLVGNSFGGFLAMNASSLLPDRVKKAVLISPAATFDLMIALWARLLVPAHVIAPLVGSKSMVKRAYDWLWQGLPVDDCTARLRRLTSLYGTPRHSPPSVLGDAELRRIRVPILLLIGDREVIYPIQRVIRRATRLVPGLRAAIVPNANHTAHYTAADAVNRQVLEFFLGDCSSH
jgi:pimeloyl-ACP methyl ester carboxylesterase